MITTRQVATVTSAPVRAEPRIPHTYTVVLTEDQARYVLEVVGKQCGDTAYAIYTPLHEALIAAGAIKGY